MKQQFIQLYESERSKKGLRLSANSKGTPSKFGPRRTIQTSTNTIFPSKDFELMISTLVKEGKMSKNSKTKSDLDEFGGQNIGKLRDDKPFLEALL